ncbi:hypothetical protein IC582_012199 [Cucumis melo]
MESSRRTTNLYGGESRGSGTVVRGDDVTDQEADRTDESIAETAEGVNLDGDTGGFAGKKLRGDTEEELVVPGGVFAADGVETSTEAVGRVNPGDGVGVFGVERVGRDFEVLGRDEVDLQDRHGGSRGVLGNPVSGDLHGIKNVE